MSTERIPLSEEDRVFRQRVEKLIREAKRHLVVISGELGAYDFPELQEAAHEAARRGVQIEVYANEPRAEVVSRLRNAGARVSIGSIRSRDHYLAVDDERVILSVKVPGVRPTPRGTRNGFQFERDPELARAVANYVKFLELADADLPTRDRVDALVQLIASDSSLRQRIPLAETLLAATGLREELAAALVAASRARLEHDLPNAAVATDLGRDVAMLNETALLAVALSRGSELGRPIEYETVPGGSVTREDATRLRRFVQTPSQAELFPQS